MINSLRESGVRNEEIGGVHSHGTSTPAGDGSEAQALKILFGTDHEKLLRAPL